MGGRVDVYGAGLSGLVAAINLARDGFDVHVFDSAQRIGGNPQWHPSIQTTILNAERTWDYIGLDLSHCFQPVESITFYRYGGKKTFILDDMFVCERGPREDSVDTHLCKTAEAHGVAFHAKEEFDLGRTQRSQNTIVATGLETGVYRQLGIPHVPVSGYRGIVQTKRDAILVSYMLECTNYDFAYLAAKHGLLFALLFSRNQLDRTNLHEFERVLMETEGIGIKKWTHSTGAVPTEMRLLHNDMVLAGTISGMIDPFVLHGISGALTSGKVAAQAFTDRDGARREFKWLAKNFNLKRRLKAISSLLPLKHITVPIMMWADSKVRGVGFVPYGKGR